MLDQLGRLEKLLERIADGVDALAGNRLEHFSDMIQRIALNQQDIKHNFAHTASLVSVQNLHDEVGDVLVRLGQLEATVALLQAKVYNYDGSHNTEPDVEPDVDEAKEWEPIEGDPFLASYLEE